MAIWPESLKYSVESWSYSPTVLRTQYATNNTRQRQIIQDDDYLFNVSMSLNSDQLATFEEFVLNDLNQAADEYTGPYYTSDVEYTGTLQPTGDSYTANHLGVGHWNVSYSFNLKNRDMTNEDNAYALINEFGGFDTGLNELMDALEIALNTSDYYT